MDSAALGSPPKKRKMVLLVVALMVRSLLVLRVDVSGGHVGGGWERKSIRWRFNEWGMEADYGVME